MATAVKPTTVKFQANGLHKVLVRERTEEQRSRDGKLIAVPGTGLKYEFVNGVLEVEPGQDVRPTAPDGSDEDAVSWLRRHDQYGVRFVEVTPIAPEPNEELARVAELAAGQDTDGLVDLYEEEEEHGWHRDVVLESIKAALRALEG